MLLLFILLFAAFAVLSELDECWDAAFWIAQGVLLAYLLM